MKAAAAQLAIAQDKSGKLTTVLRPFMIANDLLAKRNPAPGRYVIDFQGLDVIAALAFKVLVRPSGATVLPDREKAAAIEEARNWKALATNPKARVNHHHANYRSLRELYRSLELPGGNPLKDVHATLDRAVRAAYGKDNPLQFLLALNAAVAEAEAQGQFVQPPSLPVSVKDRAPFVTKDCISA